jgi:hypothetical protein
MPPKQPEDHKPKADKNSTEPDVDEYFSFEFDERTYVMPNKTLDVITPGFVRTHRHDEADFVFSAIERLTGDSEKGKEILAVIDQLPIADWRAFQKSFQEHIGANLGE